MSHITRSYRIRAYPNGAQRRLLDRWFGATRWLWNTALGIRTEAYRECGLSLTGNDLSRWLTQHGQQPPGQPKFAEIPGGSDAFSEIRTRSVSALAAVRDPKFKCKSTSGSVRFQGAGRAWMRGTLSPSGACSSARTSKPSHAAGSCDALATHLATLSTGEKIPNPKRYHARYKILRQQCSTVPLGGIGSRRRKNPHCEWQPHQVAGTPDRLHPPSRRVWCVSVIW